MMACIIDSSNYIVKTVIILALSQFIAQSESLSIPDLDPPEVSGQGMIEVSEASPAINSKRLRLCPEGEAFYNETSACEKLHQQGPCGDLQVFYALTKDHSYGECACLTNAGCSGTVKSNRLILPTDDNSQCYWAFTQGPCEKNEWYVLNLETLQPECQTNPCKVSPIELAKVEATLIKKPTDATDVFPFTLNGTCYQTFSKGFCSDDKYIQFVGTTDPYPKCISLKSGAPMCIFGVGPVVGMPCEPGYKLIGDDCIMANVDFE